ncbi:unnamed protein product [Mytilus edulis]|uniref:Uncharacterized protein n=1 Tax=Mytilus edulis TaxID=6550 RepID=A0A8S3TTR0_MYTED|nr:unnamed protein product [Mytilus edulis]
MVIQQRPNVDVYSEICMNETIIHPTNNVSFETEYESIYEDVIPETSNTENGPFETFSVLSVRIGSESCSSDENSLTIEKHRVKLYPEKKIKTAIVTTQKKYVKDIMTYQPLVLSQIINRENRKRNSTETSSSGYCTLSRQLEVGAGYHETRDVSVLSTRASQTSLATITNTGIALPTNASYEVKQCDEVENQIMPDDISIDEEERLLEEKVVELTKKLQDKIQRDERKRILHKRIAELEKSVNEKKISKVLKQNATLLVYQKLTELEELQRCASVHIMSLQLTCETNIVYERIYEDTKMKEFVNRHYHLIPPDYRFEYHDVLILYDSDNDHEEAEKFKLHLQNDFKLTNGCKVKAALYDGPEMETRTNRTFEHLEKVLRDVP